MPLEEHCEYKYLLNIRGKAASFRLRHLFLCGSLVFHVGDEWTEFFYCTLVPWVHYVPVGRGLEELQDLVAWFDAHPQQARRIAAAGEKHVREHLRMADVYGYWENLLLHYAAKCDWEPTLDEKLRLIPVGRWTPDAAPRQRAGEVRGRRHTVGMWPRRPFCGFCAACHAVLRLVGYANSPRPLSNKRTRVCARCGMPTRPPRPATRHPMGWLGARGWAWSLGHRSKRPRRT